MNTVTKLWLVLLFLFAGTNAVSGQSITTGSFSTSPPFCPGTSASLNYVVNATSNGHLNVTLDLSDASGSFAGSAGTTLNSINNVAVSTGSNNLSISFTIPTGFTGSTGYKMRVSGTGGYTDGLTSSFEIVEIPTITTTVTTSTICSGTATNIAPTTSVAGTTFSWTLQSVTGSITGASAGSGAAITQTLTNPSNAATGSVTYTVTPVSSAGCASGPSKDFTVTVNPVPAYNGPASTTVCSGTATNIALSASTSTSTTFDWTISSNPGAVTGPAPGSGNTIAQTLTNPVNTAINSVVYSVTPTFTSGGASCIGSAASVTANVNPTPVYNGPTAPAAICSGTGINVVLSATSPSAGNTFAWAIGSNPGSITGASASSGSAIAQTLTNPDHINPNNIVYNVTPTFTAGSVACAGAPAPVTVTVNPIPVYAGTIANTICSGGFTNIALSANVSSTFAWTLGTNTGGITGASSGSGSVIIQSLTNPGNNAVGSIIYNVVPTNTDYGCPGTAAQVTATVNPIPLYNGPTSASICSGSSTNISLSATTPAGGTTFSWIVGSNPGSIVTPTPGSAGSIVQPLFNPVNNAVGSVLYSVTPVFTNNSVACTGGAATVTANVNPVPVYNGPTSAPPICSGTSTNIALTATTPLAGTSYAWTIGANPGGITGASASSGSTISQTLTNPNSALGATIIYSVTPTFTSGGQACPGAPVSVIATVNPKPAYNGPVTATICSGTATNIALTATTPSISNSFSWAISSTTGSVSGASASSGSIISQTITNSSNSSAGSVVYSVTPSSGGCTGNASNITVNVNPIPAYTGPTSPAAICSGGTTNIALSATTATASNTFNWSIGTISGSIGGASTGSGPNIAQVLVNPSNSSSGSVSYIVTPTFTASGQACSGTSATVTQTVNPAGSISPASGNISICSGTAPNINLSSTAGGGTFTWTIPTNGVSAGITGASNGAGPLINQVLTNTSNSLPGTVQYNVVATSSAGCSGGSAAYVVQVNPRPKLANVTARQGICSGASASVILSSTVGNSAVFSWTTSMPSTITNAPNGSGGVINLNPLSSNHAATDTIIYSIITTSTTSPACASITPDTMKVGVNPTPVITSITPTAICSQSTVNISLGASTPSTFVYTEQHTPNVRYAFSSGGPMISQTLENTDSSTSPVTGSVKYLITATSLIGCTGNPDSTTVTVKPAPRVSFSTGTSVTRCSGSPAAVNLSANISSTFTWSTTTITSLGLISGNTSGSGTTINQTLTNSSNSITDSIAYTAIPVTVSLPACQGPPRSVIVTVNPKPSLTSAITDSVCSNSTTVTPLTASVPSTFAWSIGTVNGGITGQQPNATSSAVTNIGQKLTNPSFATAGSVQYIVTPTSVSLPNCVGNPSTVTVKVNPQPQLTSASSAAICSDTRLNYTPTSSVTTGVTTFTYDRTSTAPTIANLFQQTTTAISDSLSTHFTLDPIPVDYNFTLQSAAGCILSNQHVIVTVNPTPDTPGISVFPHTRLCNGATSMNFSTSRIPDTREYFRWSTVNAGVPIQKVDSSFSQNALISFPNAGNTSVTVESFSRGFGCKSKATTKSLSISGGSGAQNVNVVLFANNLIAQVNGAKAFQWGLDRRLDLDSTLLPDETHQNYDIRHGFNTADNLYWVMVTFGDDCVQKAYFNAPTLGVASQSTQPADIKVYPSPAQDIITVELTQHNLNDLVFEVYDLTGKRLYQAHSNTAKTYIPVSTLAPGYYTVICTQDGMRLATGRFIKN
jgi:hypothetical protein